MNTIIIVHSSFIIVVLFTSRWRMVGGGPQNPGRGRLKWNVEKRRRKPDHQKTRPLSAQRGFTAAVEDISQNPTQTQQILFSQHRGTFLWVLCAFFSHELSENAIDNCPSVSWGRRNDTDHSAMSTKNIRLHGWYTSCEVLLAKPLLDTQRSSILRHLDPKAPWIKSGCTSPSPVPLKPSAQSSWRGQMLTWTPSPARPPRSLSPSQWMTWNAAQSDLTEVDAVPGSTQLLCTGSTNQRTSWTE